MIKKNRSIISLQKVLRANILITRKKNCSESIHKNIIRIVYFLSGLTLLQLNGVITAAYAENGTFLTGYGVKSAGMGGIAVALPQDALVAVTNPAGMSQVGTRVDIGSQFLFVHETVTVPASSAGLTESQGADYGFPHTLKSNDVIAPIPEFGFNYQLNPKTTVGMTLWGAGLSLSYANPWLPAPIGSAVLNGTKSPKLGLTFAQFQPSASYKITPDLAVGISPILSVLQLKINNIPSVPNSGKQQAYGAGGRAGLLWDMTGQAKFGFSYATKVRYGKLDGYKDTLLTASGGRMNMPEQFDVGVSYQLTPKFVVGLDYNRYNWASTAFGSVYGYRNQNVWKVGASYQILDDWTLRAGYTYAKRNTTSEEVVQNILLPAVLQQGATLGVTYKISENADISLSGEYDWGNPSRYTGTNASAGYEINVHYGFLGIEYGYRF